MELYVTHPVDLLQADMILAPLDGCSIYPLHSLNHTCTHIVTPPPQLKVPSLSPPAPPSVPPCRHQVQPVGGGQCGPHLPRLQVGSEAGASTGQSTHLLTDLVLTDLVLTDLLTIWLLTDLMTD